MKGFFMKRNLNNHGFAMAETLIAAVTVISIFTLLYQLVFPLAEGYKATENYDDLDTKYIAFYIREMIETDPIFRVNAVNFDACKRNTTSTNGICHIYKTYAYHVAEDGTKIRLDDIDTIDETHYTYGNELCDVLTSDNSKKNNQFFCNKYIVAAGIINIYLTTYDVTETINGIDFKTAVSKSSSFSREFKSYVEYMPSHSAASDSKKDHYGRIIVEVEHDSYHTAKDKVHSYASIEVKKS